MIPKATIDSKGYLIASVIMSTPALSRLLPIAAIIRRASGDLDANERLVGKKLFTGEPISGIPTSALGHADYSLCNAAALVRRARESGVQEVRNRADFTELLERIREAAMVIEDELSLIDEARMDAQDARKAVVA